MKRRDYAVTLVVPLVVVAILAHPLFDRLEGLSIDLLFWLRNWTSPPHVERAQSPSVVVAIDEKTYQTEPFVGVPKVFWSQEIAHVINALVDGGAAVIGFDVILSTSVEPFIKGYDRNFRTALKKAADLNRIVLGSTTLGEHSVAPLDVYKLLVRGRNIRSLNVISDADGVIRHLPLMFRAAQEKTEDKAGVPSDTKLVPSMSLTLASRLLGDAPWVDETGAVVLKGKEIPAKVDPNMIRTVDGRQVAIANDMIVDLYLGPSSIPTYSLADLYHCATAGNEAYFRSHFEDKVVLLGTALDVEDRKLTSIRFAQRDLRSSVAEPCVESPEGTQASEVEVWNRQLISGVYLHAAAVNNLVLGQTLRPFEEPLDYTITVLLAILISICAMITSSLRSGLAFLVGTLAWTSTTTVAFASGWVLPLFHPMAASAVTLAVLLGYRFTVTDRTQRHIRRAFGRILSPALVQRMAESNQMPTQGGEMRQITVWISDLANYSTISELLPPDQLVDFLNTVYTVMSDTVEEYDGFVAQFVGDAVVAAFNVPLEDPEHARHGIESALACVDKVAELNDRLELPKGFNLRIRIGVSTGTLLVGYIGSRRRLSYSIVGDDINLASRLEGANKIYGTTILVNEVTKDLCGTGLTFREIDIVRVKGRDTPVRIFEPVGDSAHIDQEQTQRLQAFGQALAVFRQRNFAEAARVFGSLARDDPVSKVFAQRARNMVATPPPADWDGVNTLSTK